MSLRSVELQVALPRAVDAARMQEHMLQRSSIEQFDLAVIQRAERDLDLTRTAGVTGPNPVANPNENVKAARQGRKGRNKKEDGRRSGKGSPHPYKGKHIDLSL